MPRVSTMIAVAATMLMTHAVNAQVTCYQYTGQHFTFVTPPYTADDYVSATLITSQPIPNNEFYGIGVPTPGQTNFLVMTDGVQNLNSSHDSGFVQVLATYPNTTNGSAGAVGTPKIEILEIAMYNSLSNAEILTYGGEDQVKSNSLTIIAAGGAGAMTNQPLSTCTPVLAQSLILEVQEMNITQQGSSLTQLLLRVLTDVNTNNGLACQDLTAFANHVRAQTGKAITATQSSQILSAVASIEPALQCGS
jgi:hypothetical protein